MGPLAVAAGLPLGRRRRLARVAAQPFAHVEVVELLGPEHAGQRLPVHPFLLLAQTGRLDSGVELAGIGYSPGQDVLEVAERIDGHQFEF